MNNCWQLVICCAVLHTLQQYTVCSELIVCTYYCLGKYLCFLLYLFMFMWHNLMRWCFWFNLGRKIQYVKEDVGMNKENTYMYKEKSWTCWMLSKCTKKKAGLVGCYLHVQRKKLDLLLDVIIYMCKEKSWTCCWMLSILQRKKLELFRYCKSFVEFNYCV